MRAARLSWDAGTAARPSPWVVTGCGWVGVQMLRLSKTLFIMTKQHGKKPKPAGFAMLAWMRGQADVLVPEHRLLPARSSAIWAENLLRPLSTTEVPNRRIGVTLLRPH